jgi:hypothetical protein
MTGIMTPIILTDNEKIAKEYKQILGTDVSMCPEYGKTIHLSLIEMFKLHGRPIIYEEVGIEHDRKYVADKNEIENLLKNTGVEKVIIKGTISFCASENNVTTIPFELVGLLTRGTPKYTQDVTSIEEVAGDFSFGWDYQIIPSGYKSTIAKLNARNIFASFRHKPSCFISSELYTHPMHLVCESHITVKSSKKNTNLGDFIDVCDKVGVKANVIELISGNPLHGKTQLQGWEMHSFHLKEVLKSIKKDSHSFKESGWDVIRAKITVNLDSSKFNSPEKMQEIKAFLPKNNGWYIEIRGKIVELDIVPIESHNGIAISMNNNNMRKLSTFGKTQIITKRYYEMTPKEAYDNFQKIIETLKKNHHTMVDIRRQFVIYDTNPNNDAGWIDPFTY